MGICSRLTLDMVNKIVKEYPPQTPEEEAEMCQTYANFRDKLEELLVLHNITFMMQRIKNYRERTTDADDFFSLGVRGLIKAAERFDPTRGNRFLTYAEFYIQQSMRNLFAAQLTDVQTNSNTTPLFDAPYSADEDDSATIGDWLALNSSPANWAPPDPAASLRAVRDKKENKEFVDWLCDYILPDTTPNNCYKACKLYMQGMSIGQTAATLNIKIKTVKNAVVTYIPKIAKAIAYAQPGTELYDALTRHKVVPKMRLKTEAVYEFLCENKIKLCREVETEDERLARLMGDFDAAVAFKTAAMGRYGRGADFTAMRMVYERHMKKESINSIGESLGIPVSYATFLRERAITLVKEYISGKMDLPMNGKEDKPVEIVEEVTSDGRPVYLSEKEIAKVEEEADERPRDPEFIVRTKTTAYERMQRQYDTVRWKKGLVTTFARMRGGFYTMDNYLNVGGHTGMTIRQVAMMMRLDPKYMKEK